MEINDHKKEEFRIYENWAGLYLIYFLSQKIESRILW